MESDGSREVMLEAEVEELRRKLVVSEAKAEALTKNAEALATKIGDFHVERAGWQELLRKSEAGRDRLRAFIQPIAHGTYHYDDPAKATKLGLIALGEEEG